MKVLKKPKKLVIASILCLFLGLSVIFCSCQKKNYSQDGYAAKFNDDVLYETTINQYIENLRLTDGCIDNTSWSNYLKSNDLDVQDVRRLVIDYMYENYKTYYTAKACNLSLTSADIDVAATLFPEIKDVVEIMKSFNDEESNKWSANKLSLDGATQTAYIAYFQILKAKVNLYTSTSITPSNSSIDDFMNKNAGKLNGKKAYEVMYFDSSMENEANAALAKIKADPNMFDRMAITYSIKYANDFPDNLFVVYNTDEYVEQNNLYDYFNTLSKLEVGQISDVFDYDNGKYKVIVKCVDKIEDPDNTKTYKDFSENTLFYLNSFLNEVLYREQYQKTFNENYGNFKLEIFDIENSDLPYNVEL